MTPASIAVTVIVPMRNEERRIGRCLDSILANEFDHQQMEILVVDGCSTDRSRAIVAERAARGDTVKLLDNPAKIVSAALNIGIRNARGQVIIILGAHAEFSRTYIKTCLQELSARDADVVGGILETRPGESSATAGAIALMSQHPLGVGGSFRTKRKSGYVDTVPYGAYRREVFENVGLFNEQLVRNQDFEFNARVYGSGGKLFLSTKISSVYYNVGKFRSLMRQAFNNGSWLPRMWITSPLSVRWRHVVPAAFVATLLAALLLGSIARSSLIFAISLFAMYALAVTITAAQMARSEGGRLFFPLAATFVIHHFSYGAGTLAGFLACGVPLFAPRVLRPTNSRP